MVRKITGWVLSLFLMLTIIGPAHGGNSIKLEPFSSKSLSGTSFLEQDAGTTAYTQLSNIDLDGAEGIMATVEVKTSEYIVGSVSLDEYTEASDVHVYVDTSGWIAAYYSRNELPSKIIDWVDFEGLGQLEGTKLKKALNYVTNAMYMALSDVKYYDFRYPDATDMMIIVDEAHGDDETESFNIKLPSGPAFYSRTWSHCIHILTDDDTNGNIKIGETELHVVDNYYGYGTGEYWQIWEGEITVTQLPVEEYRTLSVTNGEYYSDSSSYVGLVLIYKD